MRYYFSFLVFFLYTFAVQAQRIVEGKNQYNQYTQTSKIVYDSALYQVVYWEEHFRDSTVRDGAERAVRLLQISDRYLRFCDYYQILIDSVNDILADENQKALHPKLEENLNLYTENLGLFWKIDVLTDLNAVETTVQMAEIYQYEYRIPTPRQDWRLVDEDSTINGIACHKATCRYAGRNYVAWYADNISMPYGPYVFGGLPGLIVEIYDEKRNWRYVCKGVENAVRHREMYLRYGKEWRKVTREEALKAVHNEAEDFNNLSMDAFKVTTLDGKPLFKNRPRLPSNMLELE